MPVKIKDNGARALIEALNSLSDPSSVDVGVIGSKAAREKEPGISVADVATWAELGLGQPQRSWLRAWVDSNEEKIISRIKREMTSAVLGKRTKFKAFKRVGVWLVGQMQKNISSSIPPPNAPSTIARKGSSVPLVDTGQLRTSITSRVNK